MSLPTITGEFPVDWEQLMLMLAQMGQQIVEFTEGAVTTVEQSDAALEAAGWVKQEIYGVVGYYWTKTTEVDATQTNAVGQYLGSYLETVGTVGSYYAKSFFSDGGSTTSKLTKLAVLTIVLSLLVESLNPSAITEAFRSGLNAVIDLFADEDGNIPVIVDKDGKTYFHEDMINAIRQYLIDSGVYEGGEFTPAGTPTDTVQYSENGSSFNNIAQTYITKYPSYKDFIKVDKTYYDFGNHTGYLSYLIDTTTQQRYDLDKCIMIYSNNTLYRYVIAEDLPLGSMRFAMYLDDDYMFSSGQITVKDISIRYNGETKKVRVFEGGTSSGQATVEGNGYTYHVSGTETPYNYLCAYAYLFGDGGGSGVEGITVSDDLISRGIGNAQTALEDIFPSYATNYQRTADPLENALDHFQKWFPISSFNSDVWTDGITEQESETATEGEVTPDVQSQIADAIKQILEDYYRDPDDPTIINYPEIPVSDSGDTPPENPDLLSGSSNGLWAIYNPSISEVQQFGAWLWSSNILDQITRMFNSPIDAVIGFHMIYCTPITGASKTIKAGYLDSPVSAPEVTNQYKDIDCGTIAIPEYYRNALDYDNTRISLFLPFIGIVPLDTAQVMGSSLSILYRIDVLTGTCLAQVSVIKENSNAVMYTYQGNCSVQIPLTATTYTGMVGALLSGISAGASIMTGNILGAVSAGLEGAMRAGTGLTGVRQSGTLGANAGALGIRIPYVIITHPVSVMPDNFNALEGLPSAELVPLSSVSGFTRVTYVHLENIPATSQEIEEITGLLQTGVIF